MSGMPRMRRARGSSFVAMVRKNRNPPKISGGSDNQAIKGLKMKNSNAIGLMLISILVAGCGKDEPSVAGPASEAPEAAAAPVPVLALDKIETRLGKPALANVDVLDDAVLPKSGSLIPVTGKSFKIAGFAVDDVGVAPAAGVLILVDGKAFVASYGGDRPDIANALKNDNYLKSQFYAEVPTDALANGLHDVTLRVIAADRSGYYASDWSAQISVEKK